MVCYSHRFLVLCCDTSNRFRYLYFLGVEINDCMMIGDTDSIFLSSGEAFISLAPTSYTLDIADKREMSEHNRMPPYVGMYNVGAILGSGAFGEVRLGTIKLTDERVALKFLRKADIQSMGAAERTSNEIQCLSSLSHRNIIRLFTVSLACIEAHPTSAYTLNPTQTLFLHPTAS